MTGEWKTVRLGDLTTWASGGTPPKANPIFWNGDIPWISASSMKTPLLCNSDLKITKEGLENGSRLAETNSILLLVRGSELHKRIPIGIATRPVAFNQDVKALNVCGEMRSDYLFYWLLGNETMLLGKVEHTGIGAGKLDTQVLKNLSLALPPLAEQKAIASILGALDDKIELNRRMNATLEGMARALFQSWFVDFDPVRAKLDGRKPEGMDKATAALFPDAFEESSLGPVPKGWTIRALADVIDVKHGFAFEGKYFSDERCGDILLTPGNFAIGGGFKDAKVKYYTGPVPEDYILCDHDLVLTMTDLSKAADTLGYPAMIPPPPMGYRYLHNQRLGKVHITQSNAATPLFLYRLFCSEAYRHEILAGATGTTVKHTSPTRIRAFKSLFPSAGVLEVFEKQLNIWYLLATQNESQSRTLATLRDTLLPKLLSGELSVAHSTITKGDKL